MGKYLVAKCCMGNSTLDIKNEGKENIINIWTEAMKGYPFVHMIAQPGYIKINGNEG